MYACINGCSRALPIEKNIWNQKDNRREENASFASTHHKARRSISKAWWSRGLDRARFRAIADSG